MKVNGPVSVVHSTSFALYWPTASRFVGGERKLAATLARDAKLYLLDEPLNGIDLVARDRVMQTIMEARSPENTIVMSTHLVDEIEDVIDGAIFVQDGEIALAGMKSELHRDWNESVVDLYRRIYG